MSTRQERRRQERLAKKKAKTYEISMKMVQPWSCPILMTKLPPDILGKMLEISTLFEFNSNNG